jgi:hypothetical protein
MDSYDSAFTPTLDPTSPTGYYIPTDIDDCIRELNSILSACMAAKIRDCEEIYLPINHFGIELWMRNNWGLWLTNSRLKRYFDRLGVYQADIASSVILTTYWHHLNGKVADLRRLVVYEHMMREQLGRGTISRNNN